MRAGWKTQRFAEVVDIKNGRNQREVQSESGCYPIYGSAGNLMGMATDYICEAGTTIIGRKGTIDNPIYVETRFWNVDTAFGLTAKSGLNPRFLNYFCQSYDFKSHNRGTTIPSLVKSDLLEISLPIPPLPEQQRIVAILDEAFAGLATAKANAEQNVKNARALFESHLHSVFSQRGAQWERITLEALLQRGWIESHLDGNHGGDYPRREEFIGSGVPYISANCLENDRVDMSRAKYLSANRAALLRKGIAQNYDVLFAHNATVGPVAILHTEEEKVILSTSLTYYRCNKKHILPNYLANYMRSFEFKSQYLPIMRQSTRNQIPITKQREFFHIIPPLYEQERLIVALDGLFENGQRLEAIYGQKLTAIEDLKKSLLHQAFTAQLTAA